MLKDKKSSRQVQVLHQGQMVELTIRPIQSSDAAGLQLHHRRLSSDSIYFRFHGFKKELSDEEAQKLCNLDGHNEAAVVAVKYGPNESEEIEGVARYFLTEPGVAEIAIVVRDSYQGHGLGQALLEELFKIARANNIQYLDALVLLENWHMNHLLHELHLPLTTHRLGDAVRVRMQLEAFDQADRS